MLQSVPSLFEEPSVWYPKLARSENSLPSRGFVSDATGYSERVSVSLETLPVALIGSAGIWKTSIATIALRRNCIKEQFGDYRQFICCDKSPIVQYIRHPRLWEGPRFPPRSLHTHGTGSAVGMINILDNTRFHPLSHARDVLAVHVAPVARFSE